MASSASHSHRYPYTTQLRHVRHLRVHGMKQRHRIQIRYAAQPRRTLRALARRHGLCLAFSLIPPLSFVAHDQNRVTRDSDRGSSWVGFERESQFPSLCRSVKKQTNSRSRVGKESGGTVRSSQRHHFQSEGLGCATWAGIIRNEHVGGTGESGLEVEGIHAVALTACWMTPGGVPHSSASAMSLRKARLISWYCGPVERSSRCSRQTAEINSGAATTNNTNSLARSHHTRTSAVPVSSMSRLAKADVSK
jgi:hypothetical protein